MTRTDLSPQGTKPGQNEAAVLADPAALMSGLHLGWQLDGSRLVRRFVFKGYAKAVQMANLAAWLGERMGHHPDVGFGWGWCEIAFTNHELCGLTAQDFACAARLDAMTV